MASDQALGNSTCKWQAVHLGLLWLTFGQPAQMDLRLVLNMQRSILFDLKDEIVPPTNETVAQVFARLSAYRDSMDGPQVSHQHCLT